MDNVPNEVKDLAEAHLLQQYCSYIEPTSYTDLLANIMKSIRARWNLSNNNMNNTTILGGGGFISLGMEHGRSGSNTAANSSSEQEYSSPFNNKNSPSSTTPRQPINIQFRRY